MKKDLEDMGQVALNASVDFERETLTVCINDKRVFEGMIDPTQFLSEVFDIPKEKLER